MYFVHGQTCAEGERSTGACTHVHAGGHMSSRVALDGQVPFAELCHGWEVHGCLAQAYLELMTLASC